MDGSSSQHQRRTNKEKEVIISRGKISKERRRGDAENVPGLQTVASKPKELVQMSIHTKKSEI